MTARGLYEAVLIELNKTNAPNILLDDFNYFINKAVQLYVNKRYNIYDISQQTTDDIRVLKATAILDVEKTPYNDLIKENDTDLSGFMFMGATYTVELPQDYYHLLNCMCFYKVHNTIGCYDKGTIARAKATRLTADAWSLVVDNYWNRPTYKNPYYYIHNVNTSKDVPTNPVNKSIGDIENAGTDKLYEERASLNLNNGELRVDITKMSLAEATSQEQYLVTTRELSLTAYIEGNPEKLQNSSNTVTNLFNLGTSSSTTTRGATASSTSSTMASTASSVTAPSAKSATVLISQDVKNLVAVTTKSGDLPSKDVKEGDYAISADTGLVKRTTSPTTGIQYWKKENPVENDIYKFDKAYYIVNGQLKLSPVRANISKTETNYANGEQIEDPFRTIDINGFIKTKDGKYPQRSSQQRYGNASKVLLEIRYGEDTSTFELFKVMVDYIKAPQHIRLTQEQIDRTLDYSQVLEFPDYVCQEIVNELVHIIMENIGDPKLQTHPVVSLSIANPTQQLTPDAALSAK